MQPVALCSNLTVTHKNIAMGFITTTEEDINCNLIVIYNTQCNLLHLVAA